MQKLFFLNKTMLRPYSVVLVHTNHPVPRAVAKDKSSGQKIGLKEREKEAISEMWMRFCLPNRKNLKKREGVVKPF